MLPIITEPNPCYEQQTIHGSIETYTDVAEAEDNVTKKQVARSGPTRKRRGCKKWIGVVLVTLPLQALVLVAVVTLAITYSKEMARLQDHLDVLEEQLSQVESHQMNDSKIMNSFQSSVSTLQTSMSDHVASLRSSVKNLTTELVSTATQTDSLQSLVSTLNSRIDSPVNLYQGCRRDISTCELQSNPFWRWCTTPSLSIDIEVGSE